MEKNRNPFYKMSCPEIADAGDRLRVSSKFQRRGAPEYLFEGTYAGTSEGAYHFTRTKIPAGGDERFVPSAHLPCDGFFAQYKLSNAGGSGGRRRSTRRRSNRRRRTTRRHR